MNLVIIGAGPAGEAAAKNASRIGGKNINITLIEKEHVGGLCLNKGCVPSKTLLEHVRKKAKAKHPIDWLSIQAAKKIVINTIRTQLESSLKTARVNIVRGTALFKDQNTFIVHSSGQQQEIPFDKAIVSIGTEPIFPAPLDSFRNDLLDSDRILEITKTPKRIAIVGGGAVGCEFACLLNAAGSVVTLIELKEGLLPGEDIGIATQLQTSFETRGILVKTQNKVAAIEKRAADWELTLSGGDTIEADEVLVCIGRAPNIAPLQPEKAGISLDGKSVVLNKYLQTSNPNVYVAGDAGTTRLAHAASAQGEVAAENALGGTAVYDDRFVPRCLYSWPEVASVGAWKYQMEEKGIPTKTTRAFFKGSAKALAAGETDGYVQIVSDSTNRKILGAQIIGPHATELIHLFSVALKADMTTTQLGDVMFAHPTLSEVVRDAARK